MQRPWICVSSVAIADTRSRVSELPADACILLGVVTLLAVAREKDLKFRSLA